MSVWCARDSEAAPGPGLREVERAYLACRRRKRATARTCLYEQRLLDHLVETRDRLCDQSWRPLPPVVFSVAKPKAREVCAAQFEDRVVHHWLVPRLEAAIDRDFIHDSAANRKGRGSHFAVGRLQTFMRRRQGRGWFLQLDIANFFNSIHRPTLLAILAGKLKKAVARRGLDLEEARRCYRIAARIVGQPELARAIRLGPAGELARVPPHKRLANAAPDCGLPIGNLTSQFFANLYLNELDQFVKHRLKCSHYVRYVDDFILLHEERNQLEEWRAAIETFLADSLRLALKAGPILAPLGNGADFLGYIVRPGYRLVRRRVVGNLDERLAEFEKNLICRERGGLLLDLEPATRDRLRATLASYWGHFRHADSYHLRRRIVKRRPWLAGLFFFPETVAAVEAASAANNKGGTTANPAPTRSAVKSAPVGGSLAAPVPRWQPAAPWSMASQWRYFAGNWPGRLLLIQCGRQALLSEPLFGAAPYTGAARITAWTLPWRKHPGIERLLRRRGTAYLCCEEQGWLPGGLKRRTLRRLWEPGNRTYSPDNLQEYSCRSGFSRERSAFAPKKFAAKAAPTGSKTQKPKPTRRIAMNLKNLAALAAFCLLLPAATAMSAVDCTNENTAVTETTPTAAFIDNNDGTVTDTRTGLIWMRCTLGQSWNGSDCATGVAETYTWQSALQAALDVNSDGAGPDGDGQPGFAGHADWRLPNQVELGSIVEERCWSPPINAALFPNTPFFWYWSSSPYAGDPGYAWYVGFVYGYDGANYKDYAGHVRLVRAGQ
ncbi:MAG: DUF1566 domain-containing protein [Desulfobulbales bacterium]|nr:DUF1566 domain-containing protein [Desulfobulbales bacterium]